jgi:Icc-related predicted phosphoesterase
MRLAAASDIHGAEFFEAFRDALDRLPPVDLFLLAGDLTDRNDSRAFFAVAEAVTERVACPVLAVFGNNEYAQDHETYAAKSGIRFLRDEAVTLDVPSGRVRVVGSTGSLDQPTWWQRRNLPLISREYAERIRRLDALLAGEDSRILLTHYPPTFATMGDEKEEWRSQLGSKRMESVLLRRRPTLVVHGHVHKGIPYAALRPSQATLDDPSPVPVPVHNVAWPVRRTIVLLNLDVAGSG